MIHSENLTKKYGAFTAVNNISISIPKGTICGFLGMNGAGKTTTMRMLTGVIEPSEGLIRIGEYSLNEEPEKAKKITGYIPDRPYLYPTMTPVEFLTFVGDLYETPRKILGDRIKFLLSHYSLWNKRGDLVQGFSHGMKQRLATCAALIHEPKVLIIDEPMVGLDPQGAKKLKTSLRQYAESDGMTIFLSTHSLHVAEELCDSIIIIHNGNIISRGTVSETKLLVNSNKNDLESVFIELTNNETSQQLPET
ncbi:MAG TPA: ABC transporter ATP-binding protein [Oligoflexia bacterium]|nr:ABC transporter ATP-binding protein [Oligoflexia bacterium]HMP49263.1 ABC transporter ATP-binding protein [Oligoflexia bacterium]